jgi:sugar phosphate isomerase/epimerase
MANLKRREWMRSAAATVVAGAGPATRWTWGASPAGRDHCTLSIGTYSLKGLPLEAAIRLVAETGYDGIELAVPPGSGAEPAQLSPRRRVELRGRLAGSGLELTALMEQLYPARDDRQHAADRDRLRRVMALAHDLAPGRPPLVQTVLGGGTWDEQKGLFRDRLADWLAVGKDARVVLAIKPHRGGALSRPGDAAWLIRQLGDSPWLRMVYDYSHYAFRDMPLGETVRTALPFTAHVAVKDAVQEGGRVVFVLPGESGTFDYAELLRLFHGGGYRGDFCCEVSTYKKRIVA